LRRAPSLPEPPGVDRCLALFAYEGVGRDLVARLKYRNRRSVLWWLAELLAAVVRAAGAFDVVTWVPTTPARRRDRGFDQSAVLAKAVARTAGIPCRRLLVRRPGPPQTGRDAGERRRGPALVPARASPPRVLLVDDVVTTGSSVAAAARALRSAGARSVTVVAAARTPRRVSRRGASNANRDPPGEHVRGFSSRPPGRTTTISMQPSDIQVERSMAALRDDAPGRGARTACPPSEMDFERHVSARLPEGLAARLAETPSVRPERVAAARARLDSAALPSAGEVATKLVGRLVCDRLR
jgi:predicted amidophosphoribosyltransferase